MKKLFALLLAVIMVVCIFASCGATANTADTTAADQVDETTAADNTDADDNVLTMATNASFPPYEFIGEGGEYAGIDVEIAGKIAEKLGMELNIVDTEFGSIIGGVQTGKYDMGMAGMTVNEERLKSVNFSDSYAKGVQVVIVKEDSEYESADDFYAEIAEDGTPVSVKDDVMIGVQESTTGHIYCSDTPDNFGFGEEHVTAYKNGNDAVAALMAGKVTAVIIDNEPAKSYVAANEGLKILDTEYVEEDYAICVAKENSDLLDDINTALQELIDDGVVAEIIEKYIPAE